MKVTTIVQDIDGNILISGHFEGEAILGTDSLFSFGAQNQAFLLKIDPRDFLNSTTDIDENIASINRFSIYPNPIENDVHIRFSEAIKEKGTLFLQDLNGKILQKWDVHMQDFQISLETLPPAVYILNAKFGDIHLFQKVVVWTNN